MSSSLRRARRPSKLMRQVNGTTCKSSSSGGEPLRLRVAGVRGRVGNGRLRHGQQHRDHQRPSSLRSGDGRARRGPGGRLGGFRGPPKLIPRWQMRLGRIAAGEDDHPRTTPRVGARLHRESESARESRCRADQSRPRNSSITVTEASHAGVALASARSTDKQFEKAEAVLDDPALLTAGKPPMAAVRPLLPMFATQRWPDVIAEAARVLPPAASSCRRSPPGRTPPPRTPRPIWGQARVAL